MDGDRNLVIPYLLKYDRFNKSDYFTKKEILKSFFYWKIYTYL
ncbi:hypothetical protein CAPGI0001_2226 [Capnocytophaga gingivalis ATCC 33624]|nr:hypothetical protein CAPGI0001_2226 [Capnocytophaga gingivalis ATCC 33624]